MHGAAYKHLPLVAKFLASHGARIEVWNTKKQKRMDARPRGSRPESNVRQISAHLLLMAAAIREVMEAAGVSVKLDVEAAGTRLQQRYSAWLTSLP